MGIPNSDGPVGRFYGLDPAAYYGTGAGAGSEGVASTPESGTPLARPVVTVPGWTSQGPQPTVQVGSDDTETPAAAAEYNKSMPLIGTPLNVGGQGPDLKQFGQWAVDANQVLHHPSAQQYGRG